MKRNIFLISLVVLLFSLNGCGGISPGTYHYTASSNISGVSVYCGTSQNNLRHCYTTPYDTKPSYSAMWSNKYFQGKKAGYKDSNIVQHPYIGGYQHAKVYFDMKESGSNEYSRATAGSSARIVGVTPSASSSKIYNAHTMALAKEIVLNGEVNAKGMSGFTPLHNAAFTAPIEVIQYLIDNGANLEAMNIANQTPLYLAAKYAQPNNVKYLIRLGAKTSIVDISGKTMIQAAQETKYMWQTNSSLKNNSMAGQTIDKYNQVIAILQNPPQANKIIFSKNSDTNKEEKQAIMEVKERDTIKAYERFLAEYPNSKYAPTAKKRADEKRKSIRLDSKKEKEILDKVMVFLKRKDIDGLLNYANDNEDVMEFVHNQPKIYILFSGPKGLQIGKILQYKSRGLSDRVLASKIITNNQPYRNYSLDEMQTMMELGLSDKLLMTILDVTADYEKENRQYSAQKEMIKSQERLAKQKQQTQTVYVNEANNNSNQNNSGQNNSTLNTVGNRVMDKAIEKGVESLIRNLF